MRIATSVAGGHARHVFGPNRPKQKKTTKEATAKRRQNDRTSKAKIPSDPAKMQRIKELIWQKKNVKKHKNNAGKTRGTKKISPQAPGTRNTKQRNPKRREKGKTAQPKPQQEKTNKIRRTILSYNSAKKVTTEQEKHLVSSLYLPHS